MKRVVSVLSALCLLMMLLPTTITAETYEDLTYSVSGGSVTITDCSESMTGPLTIPATIAGYPVTTIAMSAFENCAGLTEITIGKNVTSVGARAFAGCTNLSAITVDADNTVYHSDGNCLIETSSKTLIAGCKGSRIPADGSVTAIGNLAFYNCGALTAITIPDNIVSVGASAFEGCAGLTDVTIGSNVASLGNSVFYGCTALTEIAIPDSVTTIGVYAFSGCTKLASVTIGDKLATISNSAFAGCTELTDVTLGTGVITIDIFAFNGCSKLDEVILSNNVTTIGKFAFYNCGELKNVQIPESVNTIGNNAFSGCDKLRLSVHEENADAASYAYNNGIAYTTYGVGSIAVTTVTLRPGVAGVYFGNNLSWAENDDSILSYGIAVSTENPEPVADDSDPSSRYTQGTSSVLVKDILKTDNETADNVRNSKMKIYARAYVKLASGIYVYSDVVEVTLQQVVVGSQNKWEELTTAQKDALQQMYTTYADIMRVWNVPNLKEA